MHAARGARKSRNADPIRRNQFAFALLRRERRSIRAGGSSHQLAAGVENFNRNCARRRPAQIIVEDRALGRIAPGRLIGRDRRVGAGAALDTDGDRRFQQDGLLSGKSSRELP